MRVRGDNLAVYYGIFFRYEDVQELAGRLFPGQRLAVDITAPHVTFAFRQAMSEAFTRRLGEACQVCVVGYANDGRNEGFQVVLSDALLSMCHGAATPHITISVAEDGKPIDTGALRFRPIEGAGDPVMLQGRLGYYGQDRMVHWSDTVS